MEIGGMRARVKRVWAELTWALRWGAVRLATEAGRRV